MKIDEKWVQEHPKEALDLPVKFAEWKDKELNIDNYPDLYRKEGKEIEMYSYEYGYTKEFPLKLDHTKWVVWSDKELYQYWIDNIYKPE